jgi:hypothetical protein
MIAHFSKHRFHVGKPKRLFSWTSITLEGVQLFYSNGVALDPVRLVAVGKRVFDEGVSDGGREIERFGGLHAAVPLTFL